MEWLYVKTKKTTAMVIAPPTRETHATQTDHQILQSKETQCELTPTEAFPRISCMELLMLACGFIDISTVVKQLKAAPVF